MHVCCVELLHYALKIFILLGNVYELLGNRGEQSQARVPRPLEGVRHLRRCPTGCQQGIQPTRVRACAPTRGDTPRPVATTAAKDAHPLLIARPAYPVRTMEGPPGTHSWKTSHRID